jgi:hypothetical protein
VTQFDGLELPVLVLVSKIQTLFGPEFGTGFESLELKLRLFSELVTEWGFPVLLICGTGIGT